MLEKQITEDGSITFYNEEFEQSYHSKHGAHREALEKHVEACKIKELAAKQDRLRLLDVCFGLGYNSFVAITEAQKLNPNIQIEIFGLENDIKILEQIKEIEMPESLRGIQEKFQIPSTDDGSSRITVLLGDAREKVKELENDFFDAVFFDPFSPKACPILWEAEFIANIVSKAKPGAYLSTYSSARIAKDNFANAGCEIFEGPLCGRRNGGVLAKRL